MTTRAHAKGRTKLWACQPTEERFLGVCRKRAHRQATEIFFFFFFFFCVGFPTINRLALPGHAAFY